MDKKILVALALIGMSSLAFANGSMLPPPAPTYHQSIYVGVQGGYGLSGWDNLNKIAHVSKSNTFAGRAYAGIDLIKYLSIEGGLTMLADRARVNTSDIRTGVVDVMLNLHAPIYREFGIYFKAGIDYLYSAIDNYTNQYQFNLAYGAGLEYHFTPHVSADAFWMRFSGDPKVPSHFNYMKGYQPDVNFVGIGLKYRFFLLD